MADGCGAAFSVLITTISKAMQKNDVFNPTFKRLEATVLAMSPIFKDREILEMVLDDHPQEEIVAFIDQLKQGKDLVLSSSKINSWNLYKKHAYAKKIMYFENLLRRFLQVDVQDRRARDLKVVWDTIDSIKFSSTTDPVPIRSTLPTMAKESLFHHVFLSFKGEVRDDFICHLYNALMYNGFKPFMDREHMVAGDEVDLSIKEGIKNSMSAIVVFTKNYAFSTWCLDELVLILERKRTSRYFIIPILYDVKSMDVKHQLENFGAALKKHKRRYDDQRVKKRRDALKEAGNILGEHFDGVLIDFIPKIVELFRERFSAKFPDYPLPSPTPIPQEMLDQWLQPSDVMGAIEQLQHALTAIPQEGLDQRLQPCNEMSIIQQHNQHVPTASNNRIIVELDANPSQIREEPAQESVRNTNLLCYSM